MSDGVDNDLLVSNLVEDEKWIGRRGQSSDVRIVGPQADLRLGQQQADHVLNTLLNTRRSLRRRVRNVGQYGIELGESGSV